MENGVRDEPRALRADRAAAPVVGAAGVSPRTARRLALSLGLLAGALYAAGVVFFIRSVGFDSQRLYSLVGVLVFSGVGGLVASRQPRNPIGWIFCGVGVVSGLSTLADGYPSAWMNGEAMWSTAVKAAAGI